MDQNNIYSVLITAITVLGGTAAWRFYEKRADNRQRDEDFIRHDCRDRISKLEALLVQSSKEKDEMRVMILDLTKQVAELRVTVEFLRAENTELEKQTKVSKKQING
jgi:septal ring factor EnvC (AmiA/AmiB activator)